MGVVAIGSGTHWDDRRNSSQRREVPVGSHVEALQACAALRRSDPALVRWLEDGHPTLTEQEHIARFGGPYARGRTA